MQLYISSEHYTPHFSQNYSSSPNVNGTGSHLYLSPCLSLLSLSPSPPSLSLPPSPSPHNQCHRVGVEVETHSKEQLDALVPDLAQSVCLSDIGGEVGL